MQEVFEKIIGELNNHIKDNDAIYDTNQNYNGAGGFLKAIDVIEQAAAEYNNGWIPCSERLPEEAFGCLVTVMDCEPATQTDFKNILPCFVGYDGHSWNDADGKEIPFEVIAWQPLPAAYHLPACGNTDCPYNSDSGCPAVECGCGGFEEGE